MAGALRRSDTFMSGVAYNGAHAANGLTAMFIATGQLLGCYGTDKVRKFAEICAGAVLAGDISLTCAILAGDRVSSHEQLGRNR